MKSPSKNQNNKFVCEECKTTYDRFCELSKHIGIHHNKRVYYDKYLKEDHEDICPICGNKNIYLNRWDRGYKKTCSKTCANILRQKLLEATLIKKYQVKNVMHIKKVKQKLFNTNIKKYGNKCAMQNSEIHKKIAENNIKKYGVAYPFQSDEIQQKVINKFSQYRKYKNTDIYYQTSYEYDFLEKYYDKYPDIQRGKSIKYKFKNKLTYYLPDFYIPSLNLIVEIKNSYLAKRDKTKLVAKKKAAISNGFNFIMITNKRYNRFNRISLF